MRRPWGLRSLALLLLLELLPRPGDGNEGSVTGSCYCGTTISSDSPPKRQLLAHLRKHLPPAVRSTQAPTLPAGAPSSDEKLAHINETATPTVGHGLGAGPEAGEKQKQLEDNVGPTSGTPATVPVVSLLAITLALTVVLSYILCQRRREQCRQQSPDLQLRYTLVASDSNA